MATILTDNFNSYNDGDLNGQGSWSGDTEFDIQGTTVKEGTKAVRGNVTGAGSQPIYKVGTARTDGRITFYVRPTATNQHAFVSIGLGIDTVCSIDFTTGGVINLFAIDPYTYELVASYNANQWYECEIEWRDVDNKVRARIDEGTWSDWVAGYLGRDPNLADRVTMSVYDTADFYFDYIAENPIVSLANLKSINAVAKASIKSINGIVIASVKSINTIT